MEKLNPQIYKVSTLNNIKHWDKLQGYTHASDEYIQIRRDLNHRYVTIENSGVNPIGIAITTYWCGDLPKVQFVINPNEIKNIGINAIGEVMQFIHLLNPITGEPVGSPTSFNTRSNQFVLREGLQKWYVQFFYRALYSASK